METAVGAANWLLRKVINKLSDDLVAGFVASRELGLNFNKIKIDLNYTLGLLHAAQGSHVSNNPGLQPLLEDLAKKADEAEDALDELHYFMIQDELDGTREATPDLGDGLGAQAQHACHAARSTAGNWLSFFSWRRSQDGVPAVVNDSTSYNNPSKKAKFSDNNKDINGDGQCDKLPFDRVAMSNRIKQLIEGMHSLCPPISDLLKINSSVSLQPNMPAFTKRSVITSSEITQKKLFGRDAIFEKTVNEVTNCTQNGEVLSVLPIVGPGGIGKTTFTQHLYNDKRIDEHFAVKVWVCVSTNFDVLKLTKEILSCLPVTDNERNEIANENTNLDQLQKCIVRRLKSKRFLIVLDDIWECSSTDEWERLLAPFEKGNTNGNMVLVTTRFPKIVQMVKKATDPINLHGLEPDDFWRFFQVCVFGEIIQDENDKEDLIGVARQIATKLKCSPLAAKTVGRLLSKKPSLEHWMEILQNKEWLKQEHVNDIIPALKISYDYLPFDIKKCFSYCALFPEDYKFDNLEIGRFLISIGMEDCSSQNNRVEEIGSKYLDELLDNGFMMKEDDGYYVMHDLLHELSQSVSSNECAYISSSGFRADVIPSSIRHLSVSMQDNCSENFLEEMGKLKRRIDIGSLQSLMIFGEYRRLSMVNILKDTFEDIKCLRVLFVFMNFLNSLPLNFSKLVHLRYLKLKSPYSSEVCLPEAVSKFYHLKFLDLKDWGSGRDLPKDISRLVNLHRFIVSDREIHSNISNVGKMKALQELKIFCVKKESVGFELRELGPLEELEGELAVCGLEHVRIREEANEAKMMKKRNLVKLALVWSKEQPSMEDGIIDCLQPHSNLRKLRIVNHGGATGPHWLCSNTYLKNLETLHLEGVCWSTLPPFGQMYHLRKLNLNNIIGISATGPHWLCSNTYLKNLETLHLEGVCWSTLPPFGQMYHLRKLYLNNIIGISQFGPDFIGGLTDKSFTNLEEIEFNDMPELEEWVGGANSHRFSSLKRISCARCPKLVALPFSGCSSSSAQDNTLLFANLCSFCSYACPMLSLPPLPHTSTLSSFQTEDMNYHGRDLSVNKMPTTLAFHNLGEVQSLRIEDASLMSFIELRELHPLRKIKIGSCGEIFFRGLDDGGVLHSVEYLELEKFHVTGQSLPNLFKCFPALSHLVVQSSDENHDEEVLLQFPPGSPLTHIELYGCKKLILPMEDGDGFLGLLSLESVVILDCGKLFSRWSTGEAPQSINPFPPCVKALYLSDEPSRLSMALLSNLTSLTSLRLVNCKNITVDGFNPLTTSSLEDLVVWNLRHEETEPYSVAADLLAEVARTIKTMPAGCFRLVYLDVDSISAVLVAPICAHLSATLQTLRFNNDWRADSFTEEQDHALQLLTSLQGLYFNNCRNMQSFPQGLHSLPSLVQLYILGSQKIRSLPNKGFPESMQYLYIQCCCTKLYEECEKLRKTRPDIYVDACLSR